MNLLDQEEICLMIAWAGEDLLPIGNWEQPIMSLTAKGLMEKVGNGYRITDAGSRLIAESQSGDERDHAAAAAERTKDSFAVDGDGI